jgi:hypothetical protein
MTLQAAFAPGGANGDAVVAFKNLPGNSRRWISKHI